MKILHLLPAVLLAIGCGANACFAQVGELSGNSVRTYLEEFKKADVDESGLLEKEELATYLDSYPDALAQLLSKIPDQSEGVSRDQLLQAATHFKRMKGYDPRTEPDQQKAFDRWDSNGDGQLSAEELKIVLPAELRQPLQTKLAAKGSVSFADYLEGFGQFVRAGEVRRTVLGMAPSDQLPPADVPAPESLKKKIAAFLTVTDAKKKTAEPAEVAEVIEETEEVAMTPEANKDYFNLLDRDGNGFLEGRELEGVHPSLRRILAAKEKVTVDEFYRYLEQIQATANRRGSSPLRGMIDSILAAQDGVSANAPAEVVEEITEEEVVEIPTMTEESKSKSLASVTVEVVLLRRKSEKLPQQMLSEEVLAVAGEAGPSLAARLLPWLADEKNAGTSLIEYAQVTAVGENKAMVQRGGREPYVSSADSRGGRAYQMNNVGTLISLKATPTDDGKVSLMMSLEKSYVEPVPVDEEDAEATTEATAEAAPTADPGRDRGAALGRGGFNDRVFRGQSLPAVTPPSIMTMTVNASVTAAPGKPVVLSETGQWVGDQFEETLILVELKP